MAHRYQNRPRDRAERPATGSLRLRRGRAPTARLFDSRTCGSDFLLEYFYRLRDRGRVVGGHIGRDAGVVVFRPGHPADELLNRDVDRTATGKRTRTLRAQAPEALLPHDRRALVLLESEREHFGAGRASAVDDHDHRQLILRREPKILVRRLRSAVPGLADDSERGLAVQEHAGHVDSGSAEVSAKIDEPPLGTLCEGLREDRAPRGVDLVRPAEADVVPA